MDVDPRKEDGVIFVGSTQKSVIGPTSGRVYENDDGGKLYPATSGNKASLEL